MPWHENDNMIEVTHRGRVIELAGSLPAIGTLAPEFRLTDTSKKDVHLSSYLGKRIVMNIFPSVDTSTCATSVRTFNKLAAGLANTVVLCISKDLPFAHARFCGAEGIDNLVMLSQYKDSSFSDAYGVDITANSYLEGLMSRAIVVVDEQGVIRYTEQVQDIGSEPNYDAVLTMLGK